MGIPKFFRFMSERYPLISQLIQGDRIPEFDALYLDMNGIIHNCSHPDDNNASFRITEEAIFLAVFAYINHLFSVIKPQKLFFLAVDGVAPRAKMNQQRSRRFRTAKEMKEVVDKAKAKGEEIPEGDGFDSNCITPGTPFMARLSAQLKYFIAKKVSEDADWRGVEIVLSGHEVPGEGEHKIMEYIRLKKAQPGYDPNVRHCLYGLDADLIMLGLLSHDPHFCLLREEVNFGPKKGKSKGLETQNFFLMHLSLFREYLDLEFIALRTSTPPLPFEYDLERIIDDFILLNIFVGNDFLPHLPGLHINEGALGRLFEIYKRILPSAGGYLNEHGILNVKRLQLVLDELTVFETEHFEHEFADSSWFKGKQIKAPNADKSKGKGKLVLTKEQKTLFTSIQTFINENLSHLSPNARLELSPTTLSAREKRFLADLADELRLDLSYDEFNQAGESIIVVSFAAEMLELAAADETDVTEEGEDEEEESEWKGAIERIMSKYDKAKIAKDFDEAEIEDNHAKLLEEKMLGWKKEYYKEKLEFEFSDSSSLHDLAYRYIEGLQWVLHYYYSGVASWGWFYNYHYAPKISDLKHAASYKFNFDLGTPFHPFEQLMGVLPDLSSIHIPIAFRDLLSDPNSPIIDFYPVNFNQDLNGKKQDWEAIVKIPFIDEERLLKTMASRSNRLTEEEKVRNSFGNSWRFIFDVSGNERVYESSLPGFFPDLVHCKCIVEPFNLPTLGGGLSYVQGLVPGVLLGKDAISGFPSLHTIPYTGQLGYHGVNVFQGDSRKETMVVTIDHIYEGLKSEEIALLMVGQKTYTGYPYLQESLVVAVSDELFRYELEDDNKGGKRVKSRSHSMQDIVGFKRTADRVEHVYSKRYGCLIGGVDVIVHVTPLKGLRRLDDGATVKEYEDKEEEFAVQTVVSNVTSEDVRYMERPAIPVASEFPLDCKVFFLGAAVYGVPAQVTGHEENGLSIKIVYFPNDKLENTAFRTRLLTTAQTAYFPAHAVGRQVKMSGLTLSKLTSSVMVSMGDSKTNIGLNLKFEAKSQKVLGYSRKGENGWEFSTRAVELIKEYNSKFPEVAMAMDRRGGDLTRASDFFDPSEADSRLKELKAWLIQKGVRDFDKVPLYSEQLDKDMVANLEKLSDKINASKLLPSLKQAAIKGIPRQALLKPAHALTRLNEQSYALGDRVITVTDTGSVPLCAKGTVVGIQVGFIDVVFDVQFMGGTTLGDRCSAYRGQTIAPNTMLNLSSPQLINGTPSQVQYSALPTNTNGNGNNNNYNNHSSSPSNSYATNNRGRGGGGINNPSFRTGPKGGAGILPASGLPAAGFHPAPQQKGRGGFANGFNSSHISSTTPSTFSSQQPKTHQQTLASTLGISSTPSTNNNNRSIPPTRGIRRGPSAQVQYPTQPTVANRGSPGGGVGFAGAVHLSRGGIGIPPPVGGINTGTGRGGFRGVRGGGANVRGGAGRGAFNGRGARGGVGGVGAVVEG